MLAHRDSHESDGYLRLCCYFFMAACVGFFSGNCIEGADKPELVDLKSFCYVFSATFFLLSIISLSCYGLLKFRQSASLALVSSPAFRYSD